MDGGQREGSSHSPTDLQEQGSGLTADDRVHLLPTSYLHVTDIDQVHSRGAHALGPPGCFATDLTSRLYFLLMFV